MDNNFAFLNDANYVKIEYENLFIIDLTLVKNINFQKLANPFKEICDFSKARNKNKI